MQKRLSRCPIFSPKMPNKKIMVFLKKYLFHWLALAAERVQGGHGHGEKRWLLQKTEKERKKSCFAPHAHFFHTVGGSRTSKTSNSSSNNSSNIYWLDRFGCATRQRYFNSKFIVFSTSSCEDRSFSDGSSLPVCVPARSASDDGVPSSCSSHFDCGYSQEEGGWVPCFRGRCAPMEEEEGDYWSTK